MSQWVVLWAMCHNGQYICKMQRYPGFCSGPEVSLFPIHGLWEMREQFGKRPCQADPNPPPSSHRVGLRLCGTVSAQRSWIAEVCGYVIKELYKNLFLPVFAHQQVIAWAPNLSDDRTLLPSHGGFDYLQLLRFSLVQLLSGVVSG